jgi:hypothetical protein
VRTRTLLLLAIGCGFVILVAGVVQLLRVAGQDDPPTAATIGEPVRIGDMTVTVFGASEAGGAVTVELDIGGVDDPDGTEEFRLVVPGASLPADADTCGATTTQPQRCDLTFDLAGTEGTSRVLLYRRGDERARWELD